MIDFKEALDIVGGPACMFDYCTEFTDAFVFSKMDDMSFGGPNSPIVVMKENGLCTIFVDYIGCGKGEEVRAGYIRDWE